MYESKLAQGLALGASRYLAVIRVHAVALRQVLRRDFDTCLRKTHLSVSFPFPHSLTSHVSLFFSFLPTVSITTPLCSGASREGGWEGKLLGSLAG